MASQGWSLIQSRTKTCQTSGELRSPSSSPDTEPEPPLTEERAEAWRREGACRGLGSRGGRRHQDPQPASESLPCSRPPARGDRGNQTETKAVGEGGCSSPGPRTLSTAGGRRLADQGHLPSAGCHAGQAGCWAGAAFQFSRVPSGQEDTHPRESQSFQARGHMEYDLRK